MRKIAEYGIGCGTTMFVAGILIALALYFDWGVGSSRAIFQIILALGEALGSQYLAAGAISLIGVVFVLLGLGVRSIQNEKQGQREEPLRE